MNNEQVVVEELNEQEIDVVAGGAVNGPNDEANTGVRGSR